MDKKLLDILVCPVTKGPLIYDKANAELISLSARLAYPIRDDIPVMLEDEARALGEEEYEALRKKHPATTGEAQA
ncbi:MAG: Trm112 family protein [Pseudomonadota bacterium]